MCNNKNDINLSATPSSKPTISNSLIMSSSSTSSLSSMSTIEELPTSSIKPPHSSRKRRVHFQVDDSDNDDIDSNERPVKRRVILLDNVPTASAMTPDEKSRTWRQRPDAAMTARDVTSLIQQYQIRTHCKEENNNDTATASSSSAASYTPLAEALATAYCACCDNLMNDASETSINSTSCDTAEKPCGAPSPQILQELTLLSDRHTETRGLEGRLIPGLGHHRMDQRRELIAGVLGVQFQLKLIGTAPQQMQEGLAAVSALLSKPASQYAQTLGQVDGNLAFLEYAASSSATTATSTDTPATKIMASTVQPTPIVKVVSETAPLVPQVSVPALA